MLVSMSAVGGAWKVVEEKRDEILVWKQGGEVFIWDLSHKGVSPSGHPSMRDFLRGLLPAAAADPKSRADRGVVLLHELPSTCF